MNRLNENDRRKIVYLLKSNKTIYKISKILNRSISTISREIKKHRILIINKKQPLINSRNTNIEEHICDLLNKPPYVCNQCPKYINKNCNYSYVVYDDFEAQEMSNYKKANTHIKNISKYDNVINEIQKRLNIGQPLKHILLSLEYENIPSISTVYNLINSGKLKYTKKKVKKKNSNEIKVKYVNKENLLKGKTYFDFLEYISENSNDNIVEIDLICGSIFTKGYIFSLFIPKIQFLILLKLKDKTSYSVIKALDELEKRIGKTNFKKLFGIMIADQGSEFLRYEAITNSIYTGKRSKIFYCDAGSPYQKPNIENIHRLVRRVIPKSVSLEKYTQEDLNYIASNINSLIKEKYGNKTPNELFLEIYSKNLLKKLSIEIIPKDEITLLPYIK